jgi:hypothetical protein
VKDFAFNNDLKSEYYRQNTIAIDCVELHLKTSTGANDPVFLCSGGANLTFDSPTAPTSGNNVYQAQGQFIGFSPLSEDFDVKVGKFSIYLGALSNNYVQNFVYQDPVTGQRVETEGSRVVIYKAFLNRNSNLSIIDTPLLVFDGIIYNMNISESSVTSQITIDCATLFADFERSAGRKTNNGSNWLFQGNTYDTSLEKSGIVGNSEYKWGRI